MPEIEAPSEIGDQKRQQRRNMRGGSAVERRIGALALRERSGKTCSSRPRWPASQPRAPAARAAAFRRTADERHRNRHRHRRADRPRRRVRRSESEDRCPIARTRRPRTSKATPALTRRRRLSTGLEKARLKASASASFPSAERRTPHGCTPRAKRRRPCTASAQIEPQESEYDDERQHAHRALNRQDRPENSDIVELPHPEPFLYVSGQPQREKRRR